jgi:hypothetical protein
MPATGERRAQPFVDDSLRSTLIQKPATERQHIGIIVLTSKMGFGFIVRIHRTNARNLIRRNGHADATSADQNAEVCSLVNDIFTDQLRVVGIID